MHSVGTSQHSGALGARAAGAAVLAGGLWLSLASSTAPPDYAAACGSENPYLITACYADFNDAGADPASVVAFRDTDDNRPHWVLATEKQTGAIWGLAFSSRHQSIYASAFHKRQMRFGPGGPGAIYRIDLRSGQVWPFVVVPNAGPDRHDPSARRGPDRRARDWAGKTSLGDLDLNEDQSELFVVNLNDRRIYRYSLPAGDLVGSFEHGAAHEPWAEDARPFALKVYRGRLYHGVVNSAETTRRRRDLAGYVYSSKLDGTGMQLVARFPLDYDRGKVVFESRTGPGKVTAPLDWLPWENNLRSIRDDGAVTVHPMPILADIEFTAGGDMVIGIKDRALDAGLTPRDFRDPVKHWLLAPPDTEWPAVGGGDTLIGRPHGGRWRVEPEPEYFDDDAGNLEEGHLSGLASLPGQDVTVSAALRFTEGWTGFPWFIDRGAVWLDNRTGDPTARERVCSARITSAQCEGLVLPSSDLGDVEVMCPAYAPTATPTASPIPSPTAQPTVAATWTPSPTPTAMPTTESPPTNMPTPTPAPLFVPLALRQECIPHKRHADVALVIDASTSMRGRTRSGRSKLVAAVEAVRLFVEKLDLPQDQAAIVEFNSDARLLQELTGEGSDLIRALDNLTVSPQTRIDLGIQLARQELASERRRASNDPVMIVLTDGWANPVGPEAAVREAEAARAEGVKVFTIGLGQEIDQEALWRMAGQPERFYQAPDGEDLMDIYTQIAVDIPCPP